MTRTLLSVVTLPVLLTAVWPSAVSAQQPAKARGPQLEIVPGSLSFDRPGESQGVELRNMGDAPLSVSAVRILTASNAFSSDFSVDPVAPQDVPPGGAIKVKVSYKPTRDPSKPAAGVTRQAFGSLQVTANDPTLRADPTAPGRAGGLGSIALRAGGSGGLLSWIVFFPLLGIPALFLIPRGKESMTRWVALGAAAVPMALSLVLLAKFDSAVNLQSGNYGLQFVEHYTWIRAFNIEYFLGVDGISVSMVLLTALVSLIAVGASWSIPSDKHIRGYFSMFLLLEVGMMGVFCALDFFLFYVFWEVMLLPMYFLIGIWGGPRKEYAAIKFFLYTLAGSVLMLLAIIALYYNSSPTYLVDGTPSAHSFDLMKLAHGNDFGDKGTILGFAFTKIVWVGLFIGFAIKVPMFPFHTWLPDAHVEAPTAISVILAGVLLKMGTYGMMRINWPILPEATRWACTETGAVAIFGAISILYGGLCAMAQTDLKKMVAYSSVSHMGYCLLGMAALTQTGMNGALMQMFNHGTITSMLFMLVGVLYDRTHTRGLNEFGGVAAVMPKYAAFFGLAFMASLGLPGLSGFIGEALVFIGAFPVHQVLTIIAALSVVITAAYHLWAIQRVHLGKFNEKWRHELTGNDMNGRELATVVPLAVIVLILGFYPMPYLQTVSAGVQDLIAAVAEPGTAGAIARLAP